MNIYAAATLFALLIIVYGLISEVFTVLFRLIGLPEEKARFQVVSLLTGCGFTTRESEMILSNRSRRRLARATMLFGYVFNLTIVSAFVNVFVSVKPHQLGGRIYSFLVPLAAAVLIISLFRFPGLRSRVDRRIEALAARLSGGTGYNSVLLIDQIGQSCVAAVRLKHLPEELAGIALEQTGLKTDRGILVLTLERKGEPVQSPAAETVFQIGDRITVFGDYQQICEAFRAREHFIGDETESEEAA